MSVPSTRLRRGAFTTDAFVAIGALMASAGVAASNAKVTSSAVTGLAGSAGLMGAGDKRP
jgi:hypothetical protein